MKVPFTTIYKQNDKGKWVTLCKIRVNGILIEEGVEYIPHPLKDFIGRDIDVKIIDDVMVVKGIY